MKKKLLSYLSVFIFLLYGLLERNRNVMSDSTSGNVQPDTSTNNRSQGPANNLPEAAAGGYKNGTYTGNAVDAYYGNIQVRAVVSGGKLTDVQFLQYPNDRGHSIMINEYAMPILKQEAIQAQSSSVDIVSGATDSSNAFIESLKSALSGAL